MTNDKNDLDDINSDYTEEEYESDSQRWLTVLVVVLVLGGLVGLIIYAFNVSNSSVSLEDTPVIEADATPMKETPSDPGGMQFPHQDKTVYETITNEKPGTKPAAERILPAPEEPKSPKNTVATESWINEKLHPENSEASTEEGNKPKVVTVVPGEENKGGFDTVESKPLAEDVAKVKVVNVQEELRRLEEKAKTVEASTKAEAVQEPEIAEVAPLPENKEEAPVAVKKPTPWEKAATEKATDKVITPEAAKAETETPAPEPKKTQAAKPETKEEKPVDSAKGAFKVQLGAFKSEQEAKDRWKKIQSSLGALVQSKSQNIQRADLGSKGVFYRLQLGSFASQADASAFCGKLEAKKQGCFPVKGK